MPQWCNFYQSKYRSSMKQWKQRNQRLAPYASHRTTNKFHFTNLSAFGISYQSHYYNAYESKTTNKVYCEWLVCAFVAIHSEPVVSLGRMSICLCCTTHNDAADGRCRRQIDVIVVKISQEQKHDLKMMRHSSRYSLQRPLVYSSICTMQCVVKRWEDE